MHLFQKHHTNDELLISCSSMDPSKFLQLKSQSPGLLRGYGTPSKPLFCPLCGEKLFLTEQTNSDEAIAESSERMVADGKRVIQSAVKALSDECDKSGQYGGEYLQSLGFNIANTVNCYDKAWELCYHTRLRASLALIDLCVFLHHRKNDLKEMPKLPSIKIHPEDLPINNITKETIQHLHTSIESLRCQLQERLKKITKPNPPYVLANGICVVACTVLTDGKRGDQDILGRYVLEHSITIDFTDRTPLKLLASDIVAFRLLKAVEQLLDSF